MMGGMTFTYSCPQCGTIVGGDADVVAPSCPACRTTFDPEQLRKLRRRDRWLHILVLTPCAGVGAGAVVFLAASAAAPDSPRLGGIIAAGFVAGIVGGFLALKRYDAWRNGPM